MQEQRIIALTEEIAAKELRWGEERAKMMKALKAERLLRRKAEADRREMGKEKLEELRSPTHGPSPVVAVNEPQILQETRSTELQILDSPLPEVKELVELDTAALKQQMASKELLWEAEKEKMMNALKGERVIRKKVQAEKKTSDAKWKEQVQAVKVQWSGLFSRATVCWEGKIKTFSAINTTLNQKVNELILEKNNLISQITSGTQAPEANHLEVEAKPKEAEGVIVQSESKLTALVEEIKGQLAEKEDKVQKMEEEMKLLTNQNADLMVSNLKLQEISKKTDEEKAQVVAQTVSETKALEVLRLEAEAKLIDTESKFIQSEAVWQSKLATLEGQLKDQLTEKDAKINDMEDQVTLLTEQNTDLQVSNLDLQVLAQQTDKQKSQIKKEAEKKLKKEKKEQEKKDKELLKAQKKERDEKAKREKEELKKQAKERKLRERRGEASV